MKSTEALKIEAGMAGIEFIGPYHGVMVKALYRCPHHGEIMQVPNKVQQGIGCQKCGREKQVASRRMDLGRVRSDAKRVGLEYLSGYSSLNNNALYRCRVHGDVRMHPSSVRRGSGCLRCSRIAAWDGRRKVKEPKVYKRPPVSDARCISEASDVGLVFVGPYRGMVVDTDYQCAKHGLVQMRPSSVRRGAGCRLCAGNVLKTEDALRSEAAKVGLVYIGPYAGDLQPAEYACEKHGRFMKAPGLVKSGKGCARCARYGFDPGKPSEFYIYRITSVIGPSFVGFGITSDPETRDRAHRRSFERNGLQGLKIASYQFSIGKDALDLERFIKSGSGLPTVRTKISGFICEAVDASAETDLVRAVEAWREKSLHGP